jgi:maleamate amidohydrolase
VPWDVVYDRSLVPHAGNLFDMSERYANVMSLADALERLGQLRAQERRVAAE